MLLPGAIAADGDHAGAADHHDAGRLAAHRPPQGRALIAGHQNALQGQAQGGSCQLAGLILHGGTHFDAAGANPGSDQTPGAELVQGLLQALAQGAAKAVGAVRPQQMAHTGALPFGQHRTAAGSS